MNIKEIITKGTKMEDQFSEMMGHHEATYDYKGKIWVITYSEGDDQ